MKKKKQKLSSIISRALIWTAVFSVIVSLAVSTGVLVKNAYDETTVLLKENVADISRDVSDKFMDSINASVVRLEDILWKDISYLRRCSEQSATQYLQMLLSYDFYSVISISDADGIIICSSEPEMIGFDINSSDRSRGFMDLLRNENVISVEPRRSINDPELLRAYAGAAFPDRSGMVLIAVDISAFENMLESELPGSIRNRRVGDSGFMMVCNPEDLNVVSDSRSRYVGRSLVEYRDNIEKSLMNETVFFMMLDDEPEIAYVESVYDYYVIGVYPVFSALSAFKTASLIIILTEAALFPIVFIVVFLILRRRVVKQVESVSSALKRIASGELEGDVNARDSVEFDTLSDSINTTVSHLKELTSKEKSRYEDELRFANSVRQSSLSSIFPAFSERKEFGIYALLNSHEETGRNFYDFHLAPDDKLVFLMADITGSDIVTVVFMMSLRSILNTMTGNGMSAAQAFTEANRILLEKSDYAELFISASAWMGILDIKTGDLSYVNAGYRNPVLIRSGGSELTDDRPELMICSKEDCVYKGGEFKLMPGDMVFLCSDGVLETVNAKGEYYGQERLFSCLDELTAKDLKDPKAECEAVCEGVSRDIAAYTEPGKKPGEITIMCVKYAGVNE